jgi:hypothetical protein
MNDGKRAALERLADLRERQFQASRLRVELRNSAIPAEAVLQVPTLEEIFLSVVRKKGGRSHGSE